jgi:release factor glutamine methyltransferase
MLTGNFLTLREWLIQAYPRLTEAGVENVKVDAEYLLSFVTKIPRLNLALHSNLKLTKAQLKKLQTTLNRRLNREPLQYIVKSVDFHGLHLHVNRNVLIPRPETEFLVDMIIRENPNPKSILDIGTGSGAIALSLKHAYPDSVVIGTDISMPALRMAIANNKRLQLQVHFKKSDIYSKVIGKFDIIVSNPPYLTKEEFMKTAPEIRNFEPKEALQAGEKGLKIYRNILKTAQEHLNPSGRIYLEIGNMQAVSISFLAQKSGFTSVEKRQDLNGYDRYLIIRM